MCIRDRIRGLQRSIEHILDTLEQNGPFIGIVGFSSGAAITAIIASLLEKRGKIYGITLRVPSSSLHLFCVHINLTADWSYSDDAPAIKIRYMPQWIQTRKQVLRIFLFAKDCDPNFPHHRRRGCNNFPSSEKEACPAV